MKNNYIFQNNPVILIEKVIDIRCTSQFSPHLSSLLETSSGSADLLGHSADGRPTHRELPGGGAALGPAAGRVRGHHLQRGRPTLHHCAPGPQHTQVSLYTPTGAFLLPRKTGFLLITYTPGGGVGVGVGQTSIAYYMQQQPTKERGGGQFKKKIGGGGSGSG